MKIIYNKILEETKKSIHLRECAYDMPFEQSQELREEQNKIYDKVQFLKGLNEAMNKIEYVDKNGRKIVRKKRELINNTKVQIRINDKILIKFKEICKKNDKEFSKVIREFVERYVEENE